jgi:type IV pilus assembly protein PilA
MKHSSMGFNLIELMIVVAIIALLSAIALPLFQNYVARTHAARVMSETGELRTNVENCVNEGKTVLGNGINDCDPGAVGSNLMTGGNAMVVGTPPAGTGVPTVTFGASATATIQAAFGNNAATALLGKKVIWTRSTHGTWSCDTDVDPKYRPPACK